MYYDFSIFWCLNINHDSDPFIFLGFIFHFSIILDLSSNPCWNLLSCYIYHGILKLLRLFFIIVVLIRNILSHYASFILSICLFQAVALLFYFQNLTSNSSIHYSHIWSLKVNSLNSKFWLLIFCFDNLLNL